MRIDLLKSDLAMNVDRFDNAYDFCATGYTKKYDLIFLRPFIHDRRPASGHDEYDDFAPKHFSEQVGYMLLREIIKDSESPNKDTPVYVEPQSLRDNGLADLGIELGLHDPSKLTPPYSREEWTKAGAHIVQTWHELMEDYDDIPGFMKLVEEMVYGKESELLENEPNLESRLATK